jgi:hypothetical protein
MRDTAPPGTWRGCLQGDRASRKTDQEETMNKRLVLATAMFGLCFASTAGAQQYPMLDKVASRVVQKYQQSTCEQLRQQRRQSKPKPQMEEKMIQMLHDDPGMRQEFINRVAAPIANKLFECGLIP